MLVMLMAIASAATAFAGPAWRLNSFANTTIAPGGTLQYRVQASSVGDAGMDGSEIDFTASLPPGLTAVDGVVKDLASSAFYRCTAGDGVSPIAGASEVKCFDNELVESFGHGSAVQFFFLTVRADPDASGTLETSFEVSGGGASAADTVDPTLVSDREPGFGIDAFDGMASDAAGNPFTQAGGHPDEISTTIDFNRITNRLPIAGDLWPAEPLKDLTVDLPAGFVGDPSATDTCTGTELAHADGLQVKPLCPATSQIGQALIGANTQAAIPFEQGPVPIFNMVSPPNVPARFGFNYAGTVVILDAKVRSGGDYGISVLSRNTPEALPLVGTRLTFWGVPASPAHDTERACPGFEAPQFSGAVCSSGAPLRAFLRNPTSCTAPGVGLVTTLQMDSWIHPMDVKTASFVTHSLPGYPSAPSEWGPPIGTTGCERVPFDPSFDGQPESARSNSPSGFAFDLSLPQTDDPATIAEADLKTAVVTLPEGVRVNPSSADGLQGCSQDQFAPKNGSEPVCPDASKLGSVVVDSPLLRTPLTGSVYLASPFDNPFGSLLAVYLAFDAEGVMIKVPGEIHADPSTGQLTATFDNNPQLPFTLVHMVLNGGPRAPLTMPSACGPHTTHAVFTGWNGKVVNTTSTFDVSGDGHGGPCPASRFAPGFTAGTQNPVAGGFSSFGMQLTRTDADNEFSSLSSLSLPKGLLANVSSIKTRCTIEQADAHACPADSHIGTVTTGAGAGTNPFYVGGDLYLTGPYKGNPFGIAAVVHAQAGPFDLGYVVVKGAIQIHDDGSVTVATDPFPTILQGIPLQVKDIRVNLDRPGFTFNPTSCNPMSINGTVQSTANQTAGVSSRFQVGECANLVFKPKFSASTAGRTSKANGASFHVHLASNEGPHGTGTAGESNIAKVDVQLPVSLPARLTTLQKACTAAQFANNPAGCPAASFVGSATAHTPILTSPLSGPAILVSHGGQAFPDLVLVLQGEGVRLNLTGHTQIKKGITFSHFETVPDAPVASFDLTLPQGPHSALTTDVPGRNLCANTRTVTVTKRVTRRIHGHNRKVTVRAKKAISTALLMPTTITAQNGAVIHQNTKIAVTGCAKTKAVKHKTKKKRK
jgi:hypothetical protein